MGFSRSESVVGGSFDVIPIARFALAGLVGKRDKIWDPDAPSLGNTYYVKSISKRKIN